MSGGVPTVETNPNTNDIPIMTFQEDGYSSSKSWAHFNGTIKTDLISYSVCHRFKYYFDRPRMYLFTYAYNDKNANELYSGVGRMRSIVLFVLCFQSIIWGGKRLGSAREIRDIVPGTMSGWSCLSTGK